MVDDIIFAINNSWNSAIFILYFYCIDSVYQTNTMESNHQNSNDDPVGFLFIGKTGAGKTTLINSFVNHFFKKTYTDEKLILIPQSKHQKCSFPEYQNEVDQREFQEENIGESKTRNVKSYVLNNSGKKMLIIDTPGVGDTDGFRQDNKNIENIIQGIQKHPFLQAIILVVQLEFREDYLFKYYLDEIRKILTKPCTTQCIVINTNNYGDVESHFKDSVIKALEFSPPEDQWFTVQNIWYTNNVPEDDEEVEEFEGYWEDSKNKFQQIYNKASSQFQKMMTKEFQNLFDKRINLEIKMAELISSLENHKDLYIRQKKRQKNGASFLIDIQQLLGEETQTRRISPSPNVNYNCLECHRTCIADVSRFRYIFRAIITLSIYHWISEFNICQEKNHEDHHCPHKGSDHKFEKQFRSVGLQPEEIDKLLLKANNQHHKKDVTSITLEELLSACKAAIKDLVDQIIKLSAEIEELGITKPGENSNNNLNVKNLISGFSMSNTSFISHSSPVRRDDSIRTPSPTDSQHLADRMSTLSRVSYDFIQIEDGQAKKCPQDHELQLKFLDKSSVEKCNLCSNSFDTMGYRCIPCNYNLCDECFLQNN